MENFIMNIKLADRLVELRKQNKLSQEALAEKLGLSRQAISKWERAEASPDTDNLIALAELYGISLDELLGNDKRTEKKSDAEEKALTDAQIKAKESLKKVPLFLLGAIAVYVVGGIVLGGKWWAVMWILFAFVFAYALGCASKLYENKKALSVVLLTLAITFASASIYVVSGVLLSLWSIAWIVFLVIPACLYISLIKKK